VARLTILDDEAQLAAAAARRVASLLEAALAARDTASLCLTGGRTPERLYRQLATERVDWNRVNLFWGDERHVPPDHPDSNYGMAQRALLSQIEIPPDRVHRIRGELADPGDAARLYDEEIRDRRFDVLLLGVGEDAHIASIFPGSKLLAAREGPPYDRPQADADRRAAPYGPPDLAAAVWAPHLNTWRITLTPAAILPSDTILVITAGAAKADAVYAALAAPLDVSRYPAQLVRDRDWLIDRAASRRLDAPPAR
jgi:6-phosphogluconolactonase